MHTQLKLSHFSLPSGYNKDKNLILNNGKNEIPTVSQVNCSFLITLLLVDLSDMQTKTSGVNPMKNLNLRVVKKTPKMQITCLGNKLS